MRLFTTILSAAVLLTLPFAGAEAAAATGVTKHQTKKTSKKKAVADTVYITDTVYVPYDDSAKPKDNSVGFTGDLGGSDIDFDELYGAPADAPTQNAGNFGQTTQIVALPERNRGLQSHNLVTPVQRRVVKPGIEVLRDRNFAPLEGKRVGLVTNPSGVDRNLRSTIDILYHAPNVNLVALYGPEHGVRGDAYAGDKVTDTRDAATGLPVYSLYGATRRPTPEMLEGIDVMVYDIQDVGARSYTFISTLGLVMEACAAKGIEVMVLDRPNPLGGNKIEGSYVEDGLVSFVSQYKIPYIYGLTVGELANLINEEGLNCGQLGNQPASHCKLTVIPMQGWSRDMLYADTGLPWVLPSPNIPTAEAAINYSAAGICGELYNYLNIGIGYTLPFGVFGAQWIDAEALKAELDSYSLPGVDFRTIYFKPFSGSGNGKLIQGVQYFFTDFEAAYVTLTQFYVMQAVTKLYPDKRAFEVATAVGLFDKVCGTSFIRNTFSKTYKVSDIYDYWNKDVEAFRTLSRRYWLYR